MANTIFAYLKGLLGSNKLVVALVSGLPIIEVRGAVPLAFASGMSAGNAFLWSLTGSSLIIPLILLTFYPIINGLKKIRIFNKFALALENLFDKKAKDVYSKSAKLAKGKERNGYKLLALAIFVAIPLPATGVWSGCAIAGLLEIRFAPALIAIAIGNICAALIMTLLCVLFFSLLDIILGIFLLAAVLTIALLIIRVLGIRARKEYK